MFVMNFKFEVLTPNGQHKKENGRDYSVNYYSITTDFTNNYPVITLSHIK